MSILGRTPEYPIEELLLARHSPREFSGESITEPELMTLFEAAKWAASSYNDQPWRYVYVMAGDAQWQSFFDLLVPGNQNFTKKAAVLVIVVSHKVFEKTGEPSPTHSYDTGAAGQNLALQGCAMGLVVHALGGFDFTRARELLKLPADYSVEAMISIGRSVKKAATTQKLTQRKTLKEIVFRGQFTSDSSSQEVPV